MRIGIDRKRIIRVIAVLAVAVAAGQLVQGRDEPKVAQAPRPQNVTLVAAGPDAVAPRLPQPVTRPDPGALAAVLPDLALPQAAPVIAPPPPAAEMALVLPDLPPQLPPPEVSAQAVCRADLTLQAGAFQTISLSIDAPCAAGQRVVLRHAGLAVTGRLSDQGALQMTLPALQAEGAVAVLFDDGAVLSGAVAVPDMAGVRRFAVQWQGDDAFQLHAFENGADYGDPGHIWDGARHLPVAGAASTSGWLAVLGDADVDLPLLAAVYTFPATGPAPEIVVEAQVTDATCGREMLGETLTAQGGKVAVGELTLAMPGCEAKGDILVLKNLVPDTKIAAAD